VIAIADNIADSLGIHVYRESTAPAPENTKIFTISNFITRFAITLTFVLLFAFLPLEYAAVSCVVLGLAILCFLSYIISVRHKTNAFREILIHLGVAVPVIIISHFVGQLIFSLFG